MDNRQYLCIDLKSFYASVECMERGLDPLKTNLVVADPERTEKTICLAVTPSLKAYGISGRARLFEVIQKVREMNAKRIRLAPGRRFSGESADSTALAADPSLKLSYIIAPPRMTHYMEYSTRIYQVYLKHVSPDDIHPYSIDEVFIDITRYLTAYRITAHEFAMTIIRDVLDTTGITATAGIGTNLYLAKIAMDIEAKHIPADQDGVRIAELDEMSYRRKLWTHRPLTSFWRIGKGISEKLEKNGLYTMGDIARCSLSPRGENLLYRLFGVNAELLIDHAWGYEPCTMEDIKAYQPKSSSTSSGQVLEEPTGVETARVIVWEMLQLLALDLVKKRLVTDQIVLTIGYDRQNLTNPKISNSYKGAVTTDDYGRKIPKHAHGTANIGRQTSSAMLITKAVMQLFDKIVDKNLLVRRINITATHIMNEGDVPEQVAHEQLDLFTDFETLNRQREEENAVLRRERKIQEAMIDIQNKFGKNAVLKGTNLQPGATARKRNQQIGGHHE